MREFLLVNDALQFLSLRKNKLKTEGVKAIYFGLRVNVSLAAIDLRNNKVSELFKELLMEKLSTARFLL